MEIDISAVQSNANAAAGSVQNMAQAISVSVGNITNNVKVMGDNIEQQTLRVQAAMNQIVSTFGSMGGSIGAALQNAVKSGADLDTALMTIANNTSLTSDEIGLMTETVKKLGKESGASFTQLATGFAKITNMGFAAAQAPRILEVAMKAALATGTDVGQTAQILAQTMKTFGYGTEQAAGAMNVLVQASKDGNTTLQQFVGAAGPTLALAGSMNASLTSVAAAFVTLTRAGFSASEAGTQIKNVLVHLAEPGQSVRKMLDDLTKKSGIDLVSAFTISAQSGKGMGETLEKIREVAQKLGLNANDLELKLVHAMRGGLGAMVLAKGGAKDYNDEVKKLDDTLAGKLDPTTAQFQQQQQSLNAQLAKGRNELQLASLAVEHALQPALIAATQRIQGMVEGFLHLSKSEQAGIVTTAALVSGFLIAVATIARVIAVVNALSTAMSVLGAASAGPVALGILAVVAACGLLYVAYNKLTESTAKSFEQLQEENREQQKAAAAKVVAAREALTLSERYDTLARSAKLTTEQHKEMQTILNKISQLSPGMVTGYDNQGNAMGLMRDHANLLSTALYEVAKAQMLVRATGIAQQAQEKAQQKDRLNDQLTQQRYLMQNNLALRPGTHRTTDARELASPLASDVHTRAFLGDQAGYHPNTAPASPAEQAENAKKVLEYTEQIANKERERVDLLKQEGVLQRPFSPGHQSADPAGDMRKKELAAKDAEIAAMKKQQAQLQHDAGLPNYTPPAKEKKVKKKKEDEEDEGEIIADHIKSATKTSAFSASCAFFVSQVLHNAGLAVKGSNSVRELWKNIADAGGEVVTGELKKGDILKFHGKNFGTDKDSEGKGNHTGIYVGDGMFTDSHNYNRSRTTRSVKSYMDRNPDASVTAMRFGDKDDRLSNQITKRTEAQTEDADKLKEKKQKIDDIAEANYKLANSEDMVQAKEYLKQFKENYKFDPKGATTLLIAQMNDLAAKRQSNDDVEVSSLEYTANERKEDMEARQREEDEWLSDEKQRADADVDIWKKHNEQIEADTRREADVEAAIMDERMGRLDTMSQGDLLYILDRLQQERAAIEKAGGTGSAAWNEKNKQVGKVQDQIDAPGNEAKQKMTTFLQSMRQSAENILGGAFEKIFSGDTKHLFADMLKSFVQMLEQMVAKALALGIINLLTGGAGGFLGGAAGKGGKGNGGFLSVFGFDDATNDTKAARWGYDFGSKFDQGRADYNNFHKPFAAAGAGGGGQAIQVHHNWGGVTVREEADIDKLAAAMDRRTERMLREYP